MVQYAFRAFGLDPLEHGAFFGEFRRVEVFGVIVEPQFDSDGGVELRLRGVLWRFVRPPTAFVYTLRLSLLAPDEV